MERYAHFFSSFRTSRLTHSAYYILCTLAYSLPHYNFFFSSLFIFIISSFIFYYSYFISYSPEAPPQSPILSILYSLFQPTTKSLSLKLYFFTFSVPRLILQLCTFFFIIFYSACIASTGVFFFFFILFYLSSLPLFYTVFVPRQLFPRYSTRHC